MVYNANELLAATEAVAKNRNTGVMYTSVQAALDDAGKGETVAVLRDYAEESLTLFNGVTLDLNGKTVSANHVSAFQGNYIVDSTNGNGLLKVAKGYMLLQRNNPALSIWSAAGGYVFTNVTKFQEQRLDREDDVNGMVVYYFLPHMNPEVHNLLAAGTETSGVELKVEVSWNRVSDGQRASQTFVYSQAMINEVLNSYDPIEGYGKVYKLTLRGISAQLQAGLTFRVMFTSDTGVEYYCDLFSAK